MLEDNLSLPSNGKLYSKVMSWVQRSLWENGEHLERLMEEVSMEASVGPLYLSIYLSLSPSVFLSLHHSECKRPFPSRRCFFGLGLFVFSFLVFEALA